MEALIIEICNQVASERENAPENYSETLVKLCEKIIQLELQHAISQTQITSLIEDVLKDSSQSLTEFREIADQ